MVQMSTMSLMILLTSRIERQVAVQRVMEEILLKKMAC